MSVYLYSGKDIYRMEKNLNELLKKNEIDREHTVSFDGSDKKNFQYYVIDGFIVSANIQINSCRTQNLQFQNSDHNPVVMEVTLK